MRASIGLCLKTSCLSALLLQVTGCAKEVKAEFPRPPATASLPVAEEEPENLPPLEIPEEPEVEEPVATDDPTGQEPEKPATAQRRPPPPAPPTDPAEGPAPPEPPSTALAGAGEVDPELASKLDRASTLLRSISRRNLTTEQADQLVAARGFVVQARQALAEGDPRRALVLIDKGLILAEDVNRLSRP